MQASTQSGARSVPGARPLPPSLLAGKAHTRSCIRVPAEEAEDRQLSSPSNWKLKLARGCEPQVSPTAQAPRLQAEDYGPKSREVLR